jgi:type IV pilus assembly protein PilA
VVLSDLLGPTSYIKALNSVASESYPGFYTQGVTITISAIAGTRTITYQN